MIRVACNACLISEMSIPFNGTRTRSKGVISAIAKQLRRLTLKPVKSISVKFDPYHNALETRLVC